MNDLKERFSPCPTCKQYSHSIGEDQKSLAFQHFQSMYSHRGDGIPTQFTFDEVTRDHAQVMVQAITDLEAERDKLREQYQEIIYGVSMKWPNESRHETALRYIMWAEQSGDDQAASALKGDPSNG